MVATAKRNLTDNTAITLLVAAVFEFKIWIIKPAPMLTAIAKLSLMDIVANHLSIALASG